MLLLQPALAKKDDRSQPMQVVHADSFSGFNAPNSITKLIGHVQLVQGTLKITGDLAEIHTDADQQLSRIVVSGHAHIQQLDDNGNLMTGEAQTLDYDNIKGIATLKGHASVRQQGRGEAHGDTLTYNTQTSQMNGSSGGDGYVHMIFLPKPAKAGSTAPAPAQSAPQGGH
ncbi:MAG TPA: lipopolysaccharide transport periplasmic protein LptA [Rhodanobacter sp.]|nr:lipopolysaccharide transport periplasmic protein LptA [Rhodanobacter sp.]